LIKISATNEGGLVGQPFDNTGNQSRMNVLSSGSVDAISTAKTSYFKQ
jgi:hypothetical protein